MHHSVLLAVVLATTATITLLAVAATFSLAQDASSSNTSSDTAVYGPYNYFFKAEEKNIEIHTNWRAHLLRTGVSQIRNQLVMKQLSVKDFVNSFVTNQDEKTRLLTEMSNKGIDVENPEHTSPDLASAQAASIATVWPEVISCPTIRHNTYGQNTIKDWQGGHVIKEIHAWGTIECTVKLHVVTPATVEAEAAREKGGDL